MVAINKCSWFFYVMTYFKLDLIALEYLYYKRYIICELSKLCAIDLVKMKENMESNLRRIFITCSPEQYLLNIWRPYHTACIYAFYSQSNDDCYLSCVSSAKQSTSSPISYFHQTLLNADTSRSYFLDAFVVELI